MLQWVPPGPPEATTCPRWPSLGPPNGFSCVCLDPPSALFQEYLPSPPPKDLQIPLRTFFGVSPSKPPKWLLGTFMGPPQLPLKYPHVPPDSLLDLIWDPPHAPGISPPPTLWNPLNAPLLQLPIAPPQNPSFPLGPVLGMNPPPDNGLFWGVGGGLQMVLWRWGPSCGCHALRGCQRRRCGVWWMLTPKGALRCAPTHCASVPTRGTRCRWGGDDGTWGFVGGAPQGSCGVLGGGGESGAP